MTQPEPTRGQTRHTKVHGPLTIFAVASVAVLILVAYSWHATSGRMTALETRLQRLADTLDQRLPPGDWQEELGRVTKRLEGRVDDNMRSQRRRLMAELDARVEELAATAAVSMPAPEERQSRGEAVAPPAGEVAASEWAPDPATDLFDGSGLEEDFVDGSGLEEDSVDRSVLEEEERFGEMFESMRGSLGLEEKRWAEVDVELEHALESLWPEYVALSKSKSPDTAGLNRRYCARIGRILAPEEAARLGCGGTGEVSDLVQQ